MPVQTTYPGVYVIEEPSGVRTIAGVSTSVATFIGRTKMGPLNEPMLCLNFSDFERTFSADTTVSEMTHAVRLFFMNGGTQCYIVRIASMAAVAGDGKSKLALKKGIADVFTAIAKTAGKIGDTIYVAVTKNEVIVAPAPADCLFTLEIFRQVDNPGGLPIRKDFERWTALSMRSDNPRYAKDFINQHSNLINLDTLTLTNAPVDITKGYSESGVAIADNVLDTLDGKQFRISVDGNSFMTVDLGAAKIPLLSALTARTGIKNAIEKATGKDTVNVTFPASKLRIESEIGGDVVIQAAAINDVSSLLKLGAKQGGAETSRYKPLAGGADGATPQIADYRAAYDKIDKEVDIFNLMILPRDLDAAALAPQSLWGEASIFCQKRRAFLLMDALEAWDTVQKATNPTTGVNSLRQGLVKDHSAVFYPRLKIQDNGLDKYIGATGAIAGLMARTDSSRGVWKAPAGTEADIRGISGLEYRFSDGENGVLNPHAVNTLRIFPNGIVNWGARTMDGDDDFGSEYKYIPIRRTALFIEESLYRGLKWVVFEPNDEPLWAQIRLNVGAFMHNLFRQGAFQGQQKKEAYFVKCDRETTTQNDINLGIVNVWVGFAPLKPAEFVILHLQQMTGQIQV